MKIISIEKIIEFSRLLSKFREIERIIYSSKGNRQENDVEHSYQLTMLAWYIISSNNLDLNLNLIIKYALAHDLVEVYAGDTYFYTQDQELLDSKKKREKDALEKLEKEFFEFPELFKIIKEYESLENREAKFVYALDKIEPVLNIYINEGKTWKEKNITLQILIDKKKEKVAKSPELVKYFDDLIGLLRKNEKRLFKEITTS